MSLVVATGVFEVIHPGHLLYLTESKKLGDELVVIVARDETVRGRKNRECIPENQRLEIVEALKPVDKAVLGDKVDWFATIKDIKPDILTVGPDQDFDLKDLEKRIKEKGVECKIVKITKHWNGPYNSSKKIRGTR
jgi:FAD synthetase